MIFQESLTARDHRLDAVLPPSGCSLASASAVSPTRSTVFDVGAHPHGEVFTLVGHILKHAKYL